MGRAITECIVGLDKVDIDITLKCPFETHRSDTVVHRRSRRCLKQARFETMSVPRDAASAPDDMLILAEGSWRIMNRR